MSIQVTSTTDSEEAVLAANGGLAAKSKVEDKKSVSNEEIKKSSSDETPEDSETTESVDADDETDSSDSTDEDDLKDENKEEQKPKKKGGFQKRINKLSSEKAKALEEMEYWKQQALKSNQPEKPEAEKKASVQSTEGKPKADNFESHEEYVEALADWKYEQKEKEREAKVKESQVKSEYQTKVESFQTKVNEFSKVQDDFEDVVSDVDDIPLSFALQESILTSDFGPQIMYELAKDRTRLEKINRLSAIDAAREIGKIEARLEKPSASTQEKKQSKAPAPIAPVGSKGSAKIEKSPDDMSFQEYKKWRAANK